MSNPNPSAAPAAAPYWLLGLCLVGLIGWGCFLYNQTTVVAAGSDSSGYMNSARLFARGELSTYQRIPPELGSEFKRMDFLPLGFWPGREPGTMVPTYPQGLPLHFALSALALGWRLGPLWVIIGGALAAIWLCYLCAREAGVSPSLSAAGAAAFGVSPLFIFSSVQPLSDTLATTWCLAAVWLAFRARRGRLAWAWGCGIAVAIAVLVRPTNVLLLPCLVVLLGDWRRLLTAGVGGLPGALWLAYCNHQLYGNPLRTGYGDISVTMHSQWVFPTLLHIGLWLARLLPAGLLLLPLAALSHWRERGRLFAALGLWWLTFIVFYSYYEVTHEIWWSLRFILPAVPALIIFATLGIESLCERAGTATPRWRHLSAALLVIWSAAVYQYWVPRLGLLGFSRHEIAYREASMWARANLPANAIIATMPASGAIYYYTGFPILRWDSVQADDYQRYASALRAAGRPVYAMLFPGEETRALQEQMPDKWEKIDVVAGITFWKLSPEP